MTHQNGKLKETSENIAGRGSLLWLNNTPDKQCDLYFRKRNVVMKKEKGAE